jgi:hypothetical protein
MAEDEAMGSQGSKEVELESGESCVLFNEAVVCYDYIGLTSVIDG